jgi:cation diffusion facilitator family transporter
MARSYKSVYSALAANIFIAIIKFISGSISNSTAMISEGIHSLVDSINEVLLLFGIRQSLKPADVLRPFGYGRELFFWAFIVSMLIFGFGGGVSNYQGITHIIHPEPLGDPFWNYIVLFASIIFEGTSFAIAVTEIKKLNSSISWWQAIKESKDPSRFVILIEDGAAVCGLLIVLVCVFVGHQFDIPYLDGVGSLLVGLLLVGVSLVAARESRSLLMGESISDKTRKKVVLIVEADPAVVKLVRQYSMYVSADSALLMLDIQFKPINNKELRDAFKRIRHSIKIEFKAIRHIIIQPEYSD